MYVSDYGFAASNNYWTTAMSSYNNAVAANWMYIGSAGWTISRASDSSNRAFGVYSMGSGAGIVIGNGVTPTLYVNPTFYLNSNVLYSSGTGTSSNPFRIVV